MKLERPKVVDFIGIESLTGINRVYKINHSLFAYIQKLNAYIDELEKQKDEI